MVYWVPFPLPCLRCGGEMQVRYDGSMRGLAITRFWAFRCGQCSGSGMVTLMPLPPPSGLPMRGE